MKKYSFAPISEKNATILILGTMPGEQSLALQQYYGHARNNFWKIIFRLFEREISTDYQERIKLLKQNKIALWDVLEACERKGSLDSAIKMEVANDFKSFLKQHPDIKHIYFNGQKAAAFFKKYVPISEGYSFATLPSTSPANAGKTFEDKLKEWSSIKVKI
jgi:hypoxanthine-DNA glycosylase